MDHSESADSSLNQLESTPRNCLLADYWITLVTPKLIHVSKTRTDSTLGPLGLEAVSGAIDRNKNQRQQWQRCLDDSGQSSSSAYFGGASPHEHLPHQLLTVVYWTTVAVTGNGELGFDSGEGA